MALASIALFLSACTKQPTYKPRTGSSGPGYAEEKIAENRYRVSFTGTSSTRREKVEDSLLYRAAEVTLEAGYTHFRLGNQDTEEKTYYRSTFDTFPARGYFWHTWPWGVGMDTGMVRPITRYTAYADVVLLTVEQAAGDPDALSAAEVVATVGPRVNPPPSN